MDGVEGAGTNLPLFKSNSASESADGVGVGQIGADAAPSSEAGGRVAGGGGAGGMAGAEAAAGASAFAGAGV